MPSDPPPPVAAVQGASSAAVQDLLGAFAAHVASQGINVGGVVEIGRSEPADGCGKLAVRDLWTGTVISISQNLGSGSQACNLDSSGLAQACHAVQSAIAAGAELVVLSKFGKIEAKRGGLSDAFAAAINAGLPVLTSVSPLQSDAWRVFSGPLAQILPADSKAIDDWWSQVNPNGAV
jgi:hypothetical protein